MKLVVKFFCNNFINCQLQNCYIYFAGNSLLIPTVNFFQNWLTVELVIAKKLTPHF